MRVKVKELCTCEPPHSTRAAHTFGMIALLERGKEATLSSRRFGAGAAAYVCVRCIGVYAHICIRSEIIIIMRAQWENWQSVGSRARVSEILSLPWLKFHLRAALEFFVPAPEPSSLAQSLVKRAFYSASSWLLAGMYIKFHSCNLLMSARLLAAKKTGWVKEMTSVADGG
jgi:hypothetical protein